MLKVIFFLAAVFAGAVARAEILELRPQAITEWKAVYGEVEPRDLIPARARIGGTVVDLDVTEGDMVAAGARVAVVVDDKLTFQRDAIDAQLGSLRTQLVTARADLLRGESLRERGVITVQRLEQLQTAVDVLDGQIKGAEAERLVIEQQVAEGAVLSPVAGVVLSVPVARGSVITPGEEVARIGGGGVFLRLALPERHAATLVVGDEIAIGTDGDGQTGRLAKVYPQIKGGRVLADVEVAGLDDRFVGRRVPVRLPVGTRQALLVPKGAVTHRAGLDFVTVETSAGAVQRAVVPGQELMRDGAVWLEILSGLRAGDKVVRGDE
ncbi:MAG: efflux transporter periplasmic adaptor subunit [Confluentimicrobium sp.]|uniref:efflux RND transporter periplasmic adaptor subunit n=1 Tax=Actibacterium sp. TaxID=1872125 RepID=UPI000C422A1E|nr:efflux RND transporter periplasmic adaptor subunit [Actibacterium sp.]MBC58166.1 efflux transporter periplasmic adaptor subunit [Actibacterium sp.]|tara:strand:- start:1353 stop:2324 length:972 start_codon:yes stop_codon:yes gene_type:complete